MKFVVVLNKKLDAGVALNAASHMTAALVNKAPTDLREQMQFVDYHDKDGNPHPVSSLSLIVLRADNSNKVRQAKLAAQHQGILFVDFVESMTGGSHIEQIERTGALADEDLNYYGLCMFGPKEALDPITAKFSLWK
jgi:hypothetical protein